MYGEADFKNHWNLTGPHIAALTHICHSLHYLCKIRQTANPSSNNASIGVLIEVASGRAELGVDALSITPSRAALFDLIQSPFTRVYEVIIHGNNTSQNHGFFESLLKLFEPYIWLLLVTVFIWVFLALILFHYGQRKLSGKTRRNCYYHADVACLWGLQQFGAAVGFGKPAS